MCRFGEHFFINLSGTAYLHLPDTILENNDSVWSDLAVQPFSEDYTSVLLVKLE